MRKLFHSLIALLALGLVGCAYINVDDVPGSPSPDKKYSLHVVFVDHGHPLFDKSKESVRVCVGILGEVNPMKQDQFFNYSYSFKKANIRQTTQWISSENVSVEIYTTKNTSISNHIATLSFIWDKATAKFIEQK
jgi:hypothetical protein